jgi:competence protein ComEC
MLRWGLAQLFGACCLLFADELPDRDLFTAVIPFLPILLFVPRWRMLAAFLLGALLAMLLAEERLEERWPVSRNGEILGFAACITGIVERDERRQRFEVTPTAEYPGLPSRLQLSLYSHEPRLSPGQCWQWHAKLRTPRGMLNPGGFDIERWWFQRGIGATGYIRDREPMTQLPSQPQYLATWRQSVIESIARRSNDAATAGLITALGVGERGGMSTTQWNLLRDTGTAHLLAISGLHIGLVAGLLWWVFGVFRRPDRWRWLPGVVAAVVYAALAGFSLPVQRALLMLLVVVAHHLSRRHLHWSQGFGLALTGVLLLDPLAPLDSGFWLSFLAIAAILRLAVGRRDADGIHRWRRGVRIQVGLSLLLSPVLAWQFGLVPLASIAANLVAIPLFGLIVVPAVLIGLLLLPLPVSATWFALLGELLRGLLSLLELMQQGLPPWTPYIESLPLLLLASGLVFIVQPLPPSLRAWLAGFCIPALLLLPARPELRVAVLDVGQGQAIVVETARHTLIYDTGPVYGSSDAAGWVIIPYLRSRGRSPDRIIASHGDQDHAGGVTSLRAAWPGAMFSGRLREGGAGETCASNQQWQWDGWQFSILHPPVTDRGTGNSSSCVLRISQGEHAVLLTGDIDAAAERQLLRNGENLHADIVTVPHHGSRTSSTLAFVQAVSARHAVVSAGFDNQWRFPREDVVARWRATGAGIAVTGEQGAVIIDFQSGDSDDGEWRRLEYRAAAPAVWRVPVR